MRESGIRLPVCVLIDQSVSMLRCQGGVPTGEVVIRDGILYMEVTGEVETYLDRANKGLRNLFGSLGEDGLLTSAVDLLILPGPSRFAPIPSVVPPHYDEGGLTEDFPLGALLCQALAALEGKVADYFREDIPYATPQLILFTDGHLRGNIAGAMNEVSKAVDNGDIGFVPVDIGLDQEAIHILSGFGGRRPVQTHELIPYLRSLLAEDQGGPEDDGPITWDEWE